MNCLKTYTFVAMDSGAVCAPARLVRQRAEGALVARLGGGAKELAG